MGFKNIIVGARCYPVNRRGCVAAAGVVVCAMLVSACGQRGGLYLPTEAAARNRATLPQTLLPSGDAATAPVSNPSVPSATSVTAPVVVPPTSPISATR